MTELLPLLVGANSTVVAAIAFVIWRLNKIETLVEDQGKQIQKVGVDVAYLKGSVK